MPKFDVLFTMGIDCSCRLEAEDRKKAMEEVSKHSWKELQELGYEPQVDDRNIDESEKPEVWDAEEIED